MSKFEQKSALYEKLGFFKRIDLPLVPLGANGRKWVKNGFQSLYLVKLGKYWTKFKFGASYGKWPDGLLVSTLDFHPDDRGSNPIITSNFFFLLVLQKIKYYSLKKPKTQLKNCSFNFIFLNIFSMQLLHKIIKWSQKFAEIYCW